MNKQDDQYMIVSEDSSADLDDSVNAAIRDGWIPQGGVSMVQYMRYTYDDDGFPASAWKWAQAWSARSPPVSESLRDQFIDLTARALWVQLSGGVACAECVAAGRSVDECARLSESERRARNLPLYRPSDRDLACIWIGEMQYANGCQVEEIVRRAEEAQPKVCFKCEPHPAHGGMKCWVETGTFAHPNCGCDSYLAKNTPFDSPRLRLRSRTGRDREGCACERLSARYTVRAVPVRAFLHRPAPASPATVRRASEADPYTQIQHAAAVAPRIGFLGDSVPARRVLGVHVPR